MIAEKKKDQSNLKIDEKALKVSTTFLKLVKKKNK